MTDHAVMRSTDSVEQRIEMAPKPDRTTYEAARRAKLDRIHQLDTKHLQLMVHLRPYLHPDKHNEDADIWESGDARDIAEHEKADHELWMSIRVLTHAVEEYLLDCAGHSSLTGAIAIRQAASTDELCEMLQAEEDLLIKKHGPPWADDRESAFQSRKVEQRVGLAGQRYVALNHRAGLPIAHVTAPVAKLQLLPHDLI